MKRVVHFDISADDPERAVKFYTDVFGWSIQKWDGPMEELPSEKCRQRLRRTQSMCLQWMSFWRKSQGRGKDYRAKNGDSGRWLFRYVLGYRGKSIRNNGS